MQYEKLLNNLKLDLGINTNRYDARLRDYLKAAKAEIERESVKLEDESIDDQNLVVMYAAHLWRTRDKASGMPRMLRWIINNRIFDIEVSE